MTSTIVFATSTTTARMHSTALRGIAAVAAAPSYWCACGMDFNTDAGYERHAKHGICMLDVCSACGEITDPDAAHLCGATDCTCDTDDCAVHPASPDATPTTLDERDANLMSMRGLTFR